MKKQRTSESAGRKPFSLNVIVKCFLLQHIYGLSDPRLEEEIADRRSFQMFLELNSADSIPDETTICRYREMFSRVGLDKLLFESFNHQLRTKGMLLEPVTLVDATIKQAQAKPESGRDKDATFTKKRNKNYYGYKGHIGMDQETGVIHSVEFTPANIHDTQMFEQCLHGKAAKSASFDSYFQTGFVIALRSFSDNLLASKRALQDMHFSTNQISTQEPMIDLIAVYLKVLCRKQFCLCTRYLSTRYLTMQSTLS